MKNIRKILLILFFGTIFFYIFVVMSVRQKFITHNNQITTIIRKFHVLNDTDFSCYNETTDPDGLMELNYGEYSLFFI